MGKLYCLIGKSGSGKDTAFGNVMNRKIPSLFPVVTYTTRPRRTNETEGVEYHFVDNEKLAELDSNYNAQKASISEQYTSAMMVDDTELASELKAELLSLNEWYDEEYEKITGGAEV